MKKLRIKSDWLGISAAGLCLIHCMVFPIIVLAGGAINEEFHDKWHFLDFIFLAIGFIAVRYSSRSTHYTWIKWMMWITYITLSLALIFRESLYWLEYLSYAASLGLITVHIINIYKGQSCEIHITD